MNLASTIVAFLLTLILPWLEAMCGVPFARDAGIARDYRPTDMETIRSAVAVPDGTVVFTDAVDHERVRRIHWSGAQSTEGGKTIPLPPDIAGEALALTDDGWWYATGATVDGMFGTRFLVGSASGEVRSSFVPQSATPMHIVLPLASSEPRILDLSFWDGPVRASDTGVGGIERSWRLPTPMSPRLSAHAHAAEILPDGRIALVSLDSSRDAGATLILHVLGNDDEVMTTILRNSAAAAEVVAAVDSAGRLAVVLSVGNRLDTLVVEGAIVDPDAGGDPRWIPLSLPGSFNQDVVATTEGFVVSWLRRSDRGLVVEGRELEARRPGLVTVEIGTASGSDGRDSFGSLQAAGDQVTFLWQNSSGRLATRSYTAAIDGRWIAGRLFAAVCGRFGNPLR